MLTQIFEEECSRLAVVRGAMVRTWPPAMETRKALVVGADSKAAAMAARVRFRVWAEKSEAT